MTSPRLEKVLQIAITVQDITRATAFYRDVLGLNLLMEGPGMAFFDCGGVRVYLAAGDKAAEGHGNGWVYFKSANIPELISFLNSKSVLIHQEPHIIARMPDHDLWLMWIKDSEENLLGLMEERRK
jgi:methylmalonyl-CoA/ethylmalonyl-CoA epimerase